jgi:hypothetical protein
LFICESTRVSLKRSHVYRFFRLCHPTSRTHTAELVFST